LRAITDRRKQDLLWVLCAVLRIMPIDQYSKRYLLLFHPILLILETGVHSNVIVRAEGSSFAQCFRDGSPRGKSDLVGPDSFVLRTAEVLPIAATFDASSDDSDRKLYDERDNEDLARARIRAATRTHWVGKLSS
jgi:hypothetical protein